MAKVAFIGLGVMGYPMAGHIAAAGHAVTVYNRTGAKAEDDQADAEVGIAGVGGERAPADHRQVGAGQGQEEVLHTRGIDVDRLIRHRGRRRRRGLARRAQRETSNCRISTVPSVPASNVPRDPSGRGRPREGLAVGRRHRSIHPHLRDTARVDFGYMT